MFRLLILQWLIYVFEEILILSHQKDQNTVLPLDSLSQALILVFKEAFPLARKQIILKQNTQSPDALDAGGMQLDNAYLRRADLKQVWMSET